MLEYRLKFSRLKYQNVIIMSVKFLVVEVLEARPLS